MKGDGPVQWPEWEIHVRANSKTSNKTSVQKSTPPFFSRHHHRPQPLPLLTPTRLGPLAMVTGGFRLARLGASAGIRSGCALSRLSSTCCGTVKIDLSW